MESNILIRISQRGFNAFGIKSLVQHTPYSNIVSIYLVIDVLMKAICQSTIIPKMNFVYASIIFKFVDFTQNVVLKSCPQAEFKILIKTTNSNNVHNRGRKYGYVHENALLMISFAAAQGMGRSIPAATRASVFASSRLCQSGTRLLPDMESDDHK